MRNFEAPIMLGSYAAYGLAAWDFIRHIPDEVMNRSKGWPSFEYLENMTDGQIIDLGIMAASAAAMLFILLTSKSKA